MAKTKQAKAKQVKQSKNAANPLVRYLRETRGELNKVTWPTWEEAWRLTLVVLGVSAAMALFLGLMLDSVFSAAVEQLVRFMIGA